MIICCFRWNWLYQKISSSGCNVDSQHCHRTCLSVCSWFQSVLAHTDSKVSPFWHSITLKSEQTQIQSVHAYPLVIKHGNGKSPRNGSLSSKITENRLFSIAMFDYRRLYGFKDVDTTEHGGHSVEQTTSDSAGIAACSLAVGCNPLQKPASHHN